jgi:hypothetical protein
MRAGTFKPPGLVANTQVIAIKPVKRERINTTCSAVMPDPMITLVVEAFRPKRMAALRANSTPNVGFFLLN